MSQENVERSYMQEPSVIPLTVRRLKAGTYEQWRKAWDDPNDPDALWMDGEQAYIARSVRDPDVVVAFALFPGDLEELSRLREDPEVERKLQKRSEAISEFTEEVLSDDTYEILEVVTTESRQREREAE
jgi:hypothetical protein